jgi:hypothetical protein
MFLRTLVLTLSTLLLSQTGFANSRDYPDLIPETARGLRSVYARGVQTVWLNGHLSQLTSLKLVGSGIKDKTTGKLAGIACVGLNPAQPEIPSCKIVRKFYFNPENQHLYFFNYAYQYSNDPSEKDLKDGVKSILFTTRYLNMGQTSAGGGIFYDSILSQASVKNEGWNWSSHPVEVSHKKFLYFAEVVYGGWQTQGEMQLVDYPFTAEEMAKWDTRGVH